MITRRRFLQQSGLAAVPLMAQTQTAESTRTSMPAAIASLDSLRGRAVPITTDERRGRLERARALMTAARVDAVVLGGGASLTYFTGAGWGNSERLMALVLPARGEPFGVVPAFEEERVREQLAAGPLSSIVLRALAGGRRSVGTAGARAEGSRHRCWSTRDRRDAEVR